MVFLQGLMKLLGMHEFLPNTEALKLFEKIVCAEGAVTQPLCRNVLFMIAGFNEEQFDNAMLPIILEHVPAGAATKQIMHYAQLITTGEHSFLLIHPRIVLAQNLRNIPPVYKYFLVL